MNIQNTETRKLKRPVRYKVLKTETQAAAGNSGVALFFMVLIILASVALSYVYMRSQSQGITRNINQMRSEMGLNAKELQNLKVEYEFLCSGSYIIPAVQYFNLGLRTPAHGQVRRVSSLTGQETDSAPAYASLLARR